MAGPLRIDWSSRAVIWFLLAILAAIMTPSTDAITMLLLWIGGVALYEAGRFLFRRWRQSSN